MLSAWQIPAFLPPATIIAIAIGIGACIKWVIDVSLAGVDIQKKKAELDELRVKLAERKEDELKESLRRLGILTPGDPKFEKAWRRLVEKVEKQIEESQRTYHEFSAAEERHFQGPLNRYRRSLRSLMLVLVSFTLASIGAAVYNDIHYRAKLITARSESDALQSELLAARSELNTLQHQLLATQMYRKKASELSTEIRQRLDELEKSVQKLETFYSQRPQVPYPDPHWELESMKTKLKDVKDLLDKLNQPQESQPKPTSASPDSR